MAKVLDSAVSQDENGSWRFQCPGIEGSGCGEPGTALGFTSSGWPSKKVATARGSQHFTEHRTNEAMPDLDEFRAEHGLVAHPDDGNLAVRIEDLP